MAIFSRRHVRLYILVICVWIVVLSGVLYLVANSVGRGASIDFFAYYIGALAVRQGRPLYSVEAHEAIAASVGIADADLSVYPPTLAVLMQPFSLISPNVGALIWFCVNTVLLLIGLALLLGQSNPRDYRLRVLLLLLPVLFIPVIRTLYIGQLNILMFVLTILVYLAFVRKRPCVCGAVLALATWLKVWPIVLIGYFFWKREWQVVLSAVVGSILVGLLVLTLGGVTQTTNFFLQMLPELIRAPQPGLEHLNQSILGFFFKMFTSSNQYFYPLIESPTLAQRGSQIANLLLVIATVVLCSRPIRLQDQEQFGTEFTLVIVAALLITQRLWESTLTLLLPVYFLIAERMERENNMTWRQIVPLTASIVLINMNRVIRMLANGQTLPGFLLIFPFLGTMLMWLVLAVRRLREIKTLKAGEPSKLCTSNERTSFNSGPPLPAR